MKADQRIEGAPRFPDVGVIAVVPEKWGGMWLSRQQILTRLCRYFHVAWVNPPVGWRRLWLGGGGKAIGGSDAVSAPHEGFVVIEQSRLLPKLYRPAFLKRATARARLSAARRRLRKLGCTRFVLYVWQPKFADALGQVDHDVSCYHIADEYSFSDVEAETPAAELNLIQGVDQVFIHSPALMEKKGNINPNTAYVTNGVNYRDFATAQAEPADLAAIPHPRIGYIGRIKVQLAWGVIDAMSKRHPEWNFVFVGPMGFLGDKAEQQREVFARANVHYLGNKSVREIPAYTQHVDVSILAYALNSYTRYIFPLKLHESLAAGTPVVGSDIRTLQDFSDVIDIAKDEDDWEAKVAAATTEYARTEEKIRRRQERAREYDWDFLVDKIAISIGGHLNIAANEILDAPATTINEG